MAIDTKFILSKAPTGQVTLELSEREFFGLRHGFTGIDVFDSTISVSQARNRLETFFPNITRVLPDQSHSDTVVSVDALLSDSCAGDALFCSRKVNKPHLLGIRTADCVPLLVASARAVALIHAGWRGLANGIIAKTLAHFESNEDLTVLIGPCGGKDTYQVGEEVLQAIGSSSVAHPIKDGKFLLDMPQIAANQVRSSFDSALIINSGICTISDHRFHSFRRDGDKSGRNLSFILID